MNRKLAFSLLLGAFALSGWAQQAITVKGTVKDAENNPVIGATVVVKGTTLGTTTDLDGNYTIKVNQGQVLEFSYVGMQQSSVTVNNQNVINITMAEGELLDEVVIIGYGTVKKSDLTGAVSSVSAKDLQANVAKSAANALQGRIAGVSVSNVNGQPGAGMSINIRGLSSLGSNTPLYVIDGVYGDINMVDPADIASLEVLKDASAAAIYGSRAANGVVLITTKGGKKDMPTSIDVNVFSGFQNITKKLDVLDAQQWIGVMKNSGYALPESALNYKGKGTNWQDEVYRTAPITKANISISGGTKNATYNVSAGYINQEGIMLNSGYDAFNIRTKNTFSFFNDHFRVGNTLLVKTSTKDINKLVITDPLRQNPLLAVYDENQLGGYAGIEPWMKNMDNPVGASKLNDYQKHNTELLINAYAEVDLGLKGLKYKLNVGYNKNNGRDYTYNAAYDFGSGAILSGLNEGASFGDQWLVENTLHYDNTFGKHTVSGLFGYSAQKNSSRSFGAGRKDLPEGTNVIGAGSTTEQTTSGSLQENSIVSIFGRAMYSYDSRYMLSASIRRDGSSRFADGHRYGVFPSVSAGWNIMNENFFESLKSTVNELKLRASYGVLGNQEIGNYTTQSIVSSGINYIQGGAWWMGSISGKDWVSPADLTWEETKTTNVGLDASFFNGKLSLNADYFVQETSNILLGISMPSSVGLGGSPTMNAGTIQNKGLEIALNHRNTVGEVYYNVGVNLSTIKNKVKEVTVGNVQEFGGYNPQGEGTVTWAKVGDPIGAFYVIKTDGLFQSKEEVDAYTKDGEKIQPKAEPGDVRFVDFNGDGKITDDDRQYAGSPFPDFSFGIRANMEWRGFDLGLFFDGMVGNKIYNYTRARMESMNEITNFSTSVLNAWTEQNRNTDMPRFVQGGENLNHRRVSDRWIEDGSFLRLKTLEFGYTLPQEWMSKIRVKNLRVYTAMDNLFTITGYTGYTPDLGQNDDQNGGGDSTMSRGCDHGRFPLARTITFGLQLNF
ncbi:SusC/RagA family TonB-linked outer membrane protein [Parabacteroides sp.]